MGALYWNLDKATRFESSVADDRRQPELKTLQLKGFDQFNFTMTKDQLAIVLEAIKKEVGDNTPF